ncbi:septum formation inhibitor Maf [Nitratifractor salsuginis]|uniref:Nucleoside triphosphate pyrophosphatase n=1 Tax=Nitratifractor salsuginis (strain DSM 16511 / JCM 12458 / E9I37-1) TaxID=749222 RepID=E6X0H1_NITSE|nr:septum formation inhibitor Maf [Nitratifractor salsuginis]ADV46821.1 maf protein [Nitratifractor salsuginis DSM 16511]
MIRLCSASESRAKLLREFDIDFIQSPVDFDEEQIQTNDARKFVYHASKGKLEAAEAAFGLEIPLLVADTVIAGPRGQILRKAKDRDDAERILRTISGEEIAIVSCAHLKSARRYFLDLSATHYRFAPFDETELQRYLESGEWQGKAGACMVEGFCKPYIEKVQGLESTAMGLQVEILRPWIEV